MDGGGERDVRAHERLLIPSYDPITERPHGRLSGHHQIHGRGKHEAVFLTVKPSSIIVVMLAPIAVLTLTWMLGPGAIWVLRNVDGITLNDDVRPPASLPPNELTGKDWAAAVSAVRGNVLAMATGLAALLAVFYTARNADTARRTFRLSERGLDVDRFSNAVEQLGSDQAPIRLGGLYALEQLAQDNPELRQRVVDVICSYLRMPWTPQREADQQQRIRTAQRTARTGLTSRTTTRTGRSTDEERQIRLTAQRLLADHLRWSKRRWWKRSIAVNPLFWPGIRLDLTDATLLDFDFIGCHAHHIDLDGATFVGDALFVTATFTGRAWFEQARFTGDAWFTGATFASNALFNGTMFTHHVWFDGAKFTGRAWFDAATFAGDARFDGASFTGRAWFGAATFASDVSFENTQGACVDLGGARVTQVEGMHTWPPGWRLVSGPAGALLRLGDLPATSTAKEQSGAEPTLRTGRAGDGPT
ncbi:hypothetical protein FXF51_01960 [Nonomuraea sp. PA05]|uniref:pentapeptide repeat-containing protein n=1 Tax=Nonomuraea sp. PA05 TaxID=2604466 RepID=UPI0011DB07DC|nr:pentapeptide repeat-containing protein [Nonomuraea sp. PA05]TYB71226.1 hypothetical protein FXF51_01960 [Nonomuraea sp. PA05]